MNKILLLCKGYYIVTLTQGQYGRFINICRNNSVKIFFVKSVEDECTFRVAYSDIEVIKRVSEKGICRVKISKCQGIAGIIKKYNDRIFFAIGGMVFVIMLYLMQLHMWSIEFDGNLMCRDENIIDTLKENGVYNGMPIKDIHCDEIEKLLRKEYNLITWISAEIQGTKLILHIKENEDETPDETIEEGYYDIIAAHDGVIKDMVTISGTPEIIPGKVVKKGDVLVRGELDIYNDNLEIQAVHDVIPKAYINGEYCYNYDEYLKDFSENVSSKDILYNKYNHFLFKLKEKGIQIIQKDVKIEKADHGYRIHGNIKVYGEIGIKRKKLASDREDIIQDECN